MGHEYKKQKPGRRNVAGFFCGILLCLSLSGVALLVGFNIAGNDAATDSVNEQIDIVDYALTNSNSWQHFIGRINDLNERAGEYYYIPVYDSLDYDICIVFALLKVDRALSERERFAFAADWLGKNFFQGDFIVLRDGYENDGALACDLKAKDPKPKADPANPLVVDSWYQRFQGSCGGSCTGDILYYTLLQPGLKIDWPKKIRLVHSEGHEHDHVPNMNHTVGVDQMQQRLKRYFETRERFKHAELERYLKKREKTQTQ